MATKYWVGNSGNWTDTAHWALSSGGSGGTGIPTANDPVIFDGNSFTTTGQTVTIKLGSMCKGFDFSAVTNSPTLAGSGYTIGVTDGAAVFSSAMTFSSGTITFLGGNCSLKTNGLVVFGVNINDYMGGIHTPLTFNLLDNFTATSGLTIYSCTFNSNDFNITCGNILLIKGFNDYNSYINFGSSLIICNKFEYNSHSGVHADFGTSTIRVIQHFDYSNFGGTYPTFYNLTLDNAGSPSTTEFSFYCDPEILPITVSNNFTIAPGYSLVRLESWWPYDDVVISVVGDISISGTAEQILTLTSGSYSASTVRLLKDYGTVSINYTSLVGICASGSTTTGTDTFCTGGTASSLDHWSGMLPEYAFDSDPNYDWLGLAYPNWIKYDLGVGVTKIADRYAINCADTSSTYFTDWTFSGSNDDSTWVELDARSSSIANGVFEIDNTTAYRYYKLDISGGLYSGPWIRSLRILEGAEYNTGATFYALTSNGCIDGGGNAGWIFIDVPAIRYWVGNSGNWNDISHWSYTSGGEGGAQVPTINDDVIFDENSFSQDTGFINFGEE